MIPTLTTLEEASKAYLNHLKEQGKHERTLYTYAKDLEQIQLFFTPERPITRISLSLVGRFLKSPELLQLKNGQERKQATVNKTIRVFRMFLVWLHQEGFIRELPLPKSMLVGQGRVKICPNNP